MTEYHKIETLYERDDQTHKVKPELILKNPVYGTIKEWDFTEKIDGTNIRCIWDGQKLAFGGKTDRAQIPGDLVSYLYDTVSAAKLAEMFQCPVVIYGEGYGAGIQKGGDYSPTKKFIVFDVLVDGKYWLNWENTCDVAAKLGLDVVPFIGRMTLEEATDLVRRGFRSALNGGKMQAEGLVGRTLIPLFTCDGKRLIVKLKTKDF
jgi:hypothetical protein